MPPKASFAVVLLVSAGWAVSQPALAAPGEGDGKRAELRQKVLQKFDKNGNGQLEPDEREAAKEAMQKRREQGGGQGKEGAGPDPERRKKLLEKFDKDGDGKLSESERAEAKAAREARAKKKSSAILIDINEFACARGAATIAMPTLRVGRASWPSTTRCSSA